GSIINFRYQELSDGGVPRFPSYVGIRIDVDVPEPPPTPAPAKKAAKPAAPKPAAVPSSKPRYFEFVEGKSSKFWEVAVSGNEMTVRYGRIGTQGQSKTKTFADGPAASAAAAKLIEEKTGDGYVEK